MICLPLPRSSAGRPEEHDLARQLVGDRRPGRSPRRPRTRPSCCGRSHGRDPAARRTRRGSRSAGRRPPGRPVSVARIAVASEPAGCSTAKPWRAQRLGDPGRPPGPPRRPARGRAWIRCDRSRISSRAASTAAARRRLGVGERLGGPGGGRLGHGGLGRRAIGATRRHRAAGATSRPLRPRSAFRRTGRPRRGRRGPG